MAVHIWGVVQDEDGRTHFVALNAVDRFTSDPEGDPNVTVLGLRGGYTIRIPAGPAEVFGAIAPQILATGEQIATVYWPPVTPATQKSRLKKLVEGGGEK